MHVSKVLIIAVMALAITAFLFLIDTAINPDDSGRKATTNTNTTQTVPVGSNVNVGAAE